MSDLPNGAEREDMVKVDLTGADALETLALLAAKRHRAALARLKQEPREGPAAQRPPAADR